MKAKTTYLFNCYCDEFEEKTKFLSFIEDKYFNDIVSLGNEAIPLIIQKIKDKPSHLFNALHLLTGEKPIEPGHEGRINEICQDWIKWYERTYYM